MRQAAYCISCLLLVCAVVHEAAGPRQSLHAAPAKPTGVDVTRLSRIGELIEQGIRDKELPGAVVVAGRSTGLFYDQAFGDRALVPAAEPMTRDTIFDLASLTKVVATTTSVMMLIEEGRVRLNDPVARFIPGFGRYGKERITIRHLLTHVSGLRPDLDLGAEFSGYDTAIARAIEEVPLAPPGERSIYSDINFLLLGEVVARASGTSLDRFARERIFDPLGMHDTMFRPSPALVPRIAPTEPCPPLGWPCSGPGAHLLRGTVHDPTARRMGGVAGHAGLFGTAADLAVFCRMLLGGGALGQTRILSPLSVAKMTTAATPPGMPGVRGLGWDVDSSLSANRGELLPVGSFGHSGFTGTSLWIDPFTDVFVVFLSNRVHPDGRGDVTGLRAKVATVTASALRHLAPAEALRSRQWTGADYGAAAARLPGIASSPVLTGIDVLRSEHFDRLKGRRVGLVTNQVGRARNGETTIDLLKSAEGVTLVALFSPEHGIRGLADTKIASSRDEATGLPIHSLYGDTLRPTPAMLEGIDTLVVDLQDIGTRFYTYMSTLGYLMEEAAPRHVGVIVLDRPNPIDGFDIEGPWPDQEASGFTAYFAMPVRHALTLGELARVFNAERKIGAELTVVEMKNWRRGDWFDETGVPWTNPSPNMRNLLQATLYPGIGAFEGANLSVGRGTDSPFEQIGAPWIDGGRLADAVNARKLPGVRVYPVSFTPAAGAKFGGEMCHGVFLIVTDREVLKPVRLGVEIAAALVRLHGSQFEVERAAALFGSRTDLARLRAGEDPAVIAAAWAGAEAKWRLLTAPYLLYR